MLPKSVVVLVNADFESRAVELSSDAPRGYEADAAVLDTARVIEQAVAELGVACSQLRVTTSLRGVRKALNALRPEVVFNLVESIDNDYGREYQVPLLLERAGFPYTGNAALPLRLCRTKDRARRWLARAGVPVAAGVVVQGPRDPKLSSKLPYPVFVKPARVDGSIGVDAASVCHDVDALRKKLAQLEGHVPGPFLVERFLSGKEINVSLFPSPEDGHVVATEIDFSPVPAHLPRFITYESKWNPESPEYASRSVPANLSPAMHAEVGELARRAFLALGGTGYGRVDLRLDEAGRPFVIDVNPNNDLHVDAGLARAAASAGVSYPKLIASVLLHALKVHRATRAAIAG